MHEIRPARSLNLLWIWIGLVWLILATPIILAGCDSDSPPPASAPQKSTPAIAYKGTIVAVGDSLTAGLGVMEQEAYPAQLERRLIADGHPYKVVNAGVSGETSSGALSRIQWVIDALKPEIVILETGANDGLRGIDPALLRSNLNRLVTLLKAEEIEVILAGMQMLPNLGPEYTREFGRIYPEVARRYRIILVPFFLEGVAGRNDLNQPDKLHPTAQGYSQVVDTIYPFVLKAIERKER
jgi:acyl-CoA thioesterase-1